MTAPHLRTHEPEVDVRVVPMRRRHLRSVLRIEGQVCPRPWTVGMFLSELGLGSDRCYLVARAGASLVGYGGLMIGANEGHVTTLAVDPAWQRRTVGIRLLLGLVEWGVEHECEGLTLEVRMANVAAQALYRRFGFVPAGVRRNYYAETNEDALIMWATAFGLRPMANGWRPSPPAWLTMPRSEAPGEGCGSGHDRSDTIVLGIETSWAGR